MTVTQRSVTSRNGYAWDITVQASSLEQWRNEVAEAVRALGGDPEAVAVARLGASELLANVLKHTDDRWCRLRVERQGDSIWVGTSDRSLEVPAVTVPRRDGESGRGLWLLREMTAVLGYSCTPGGKTVWFRVPLSAPAHPGSERRGTAPPQAGRRNP
ncbi:ATP-binding protein [Streptomyces aidingensis]|uniref:Serine/threonine-protein kinase RsbW n=1 Tax=Streptomyces aidingensis TaxID=910347 RepID=A0A1I1S403_9ACTN|nr:ATP-binding protein [Streptomyces aidingensis]SFD41097.1 serine/threonine-protein kinase RsbW [Streptomyces aidingensis]